ncbi:helix-turn-helix transcriptional regulator [Paenibacillus antri]|uniref:Helix-turn-helix transcriptional regulator n=1 Tax=Paenibacillus antri TaxID=2582848 RepID=A0A5R9GEG2_9BACL|nr:LuxR C-terminal-related transcriptional regulator [Paenibacillus antri]TLS51738.1 helix-turn-helix transcriptional regulator [Paenibacillus antri]
MRFFEEREDAFLVGRERERVLFERFLNGDPEVRPVWSVYGTGGVGKSTLLDAFRRQARSHGAAFYLLDSREVGRTGEAFCEALSERMDLHDGRGAANGSPLDRVLERLHEEASHRRVAIAIDTFEEMSLLEGWLRDEFLRRLPSEALVLLSGRHPLRGQWLTSPAWRERTHWLAIDHLERDAVLDYAGKCGLAEPEQGERLWERTQGHGLSLALAVAAERIGGGGPVDLSSGWSSELAALWLKEVPDEELRELVEAASMLRYFNQEVLEHITERRVGASAFSGIAELSFVRKTGNGWRLHDLMRESTRAQLRERAPGKFRKLMERCVLYYATLIRESYRKRDVAAEVGELFYYIGDQNIRAFLNAADEQEYMWEPLSAANLEEGIRYLRRRRDEAKPVTRRGVDPATGELLELTLAKEEALYSIAGLDLAELAELGPHTVQLMKGTDGTVCGLSAMISIGADTLDYLERDPFSGPYFRSLTPAEREALAVPGPDPAGWFIRSIDILDWNDSSMLLEAGSQMYNYMCAGKLFVTSPPPLEMFRESHLGLGFRLLPNVTHCAYDGKTPAPAFALDTRGEKLEAFLAAMLRRIGVDLEPARGAAPGDPTRSPEERERRLAALGLTEREREVAQLAIDGCSNADIAARLFVTEITVKKHLSSVYAKTQVKNRGQLIKAILQ